MPETSNERVTLAILGEKIDRLQITMDQSGIETRKWREKIEEQVLNLRIEQEKLKQSQSNSAKVMVGISLLLSVLAGFIGVKF